MPVLTILAHGATAGVAPGQKTHIAARGNTIGWSTAATRRNTAFLRSVNHDALTGHGHAGTLTLRNCPDSPEDWHRTRTNFVKRLRRIGLTRMHWVVEWQKRRVPHLHIAVWFDQPGDFGPEIKAHWIESAMQYRPALLSQTVVPITSFGGWAQYVAKHSARGAGHYQRNIAARPSGWTSSGRVWGKCGQWPTIEPKRLEIAPRAFHALRRAMRSWRIADARMRKNPRQVTQARTMLRCRNRDLSNVRGVSEWIPQEVTDRLVTWLTVTGHSVLDSPTTAERIASRLAEGLDNAPSQRKAEFTGRRRHRA